MVDHGDEVGERVAFPGGEADYPGPSAGCQY